MREPISSEILSQNAHFQGGELYIAGISATELADTFQTPIFILDEDDFFSRATRFNEALKSAFRENAGECFYAAKSFISVEVARWLNSIGLSLDVCTQGELEVALAANFPPERMEFHGNNKSEAEISKAIEVGIGKIVVDSEIELERINKIANQRGVRQQILIRLTPGVEAHTHEFISTAHEDVKFGLSIASGAAIHAMKRAATLPGVELLGVHFHIGSQITVHQGYEIAIERTIALMKNFESETGITLSEFDIGGGFAIAYIEGDLATDPSEMLNRLAVKVKSECELHSFAHPKISIEPGRAIVGPAMCTLYEVGTVKLVEVGAIDKSPVKVQRRNYISVDGGMSENIRTALYGAEYSVALANRESSADLISSRVVGKHCETGDIVVNDCLLPSDIAPGDLLVTPATGAYGRSMASNYNHLPRPPVVAVKNGKARTILRRESYSDLLRLEVTSE